MLHVVKGTRVELEVDLTSRKQRDLRSRGNLSYRCEREVCKEGGERGSRTRCARAHLEHLAEHLDRSVVERLLAGAHGLRWMWSLTPPNSPHLDRPRPPS
eukprot:3073529-Prymnesium_polylepis.1